MPAEKEGLIQAVFEGGRAATAPFTWAQRSIWDTIRRHPPATFNLCLVVRVVPPVAVSDAVRAIEQLVIRHEALRTLVRDVDGEMQQLVLGSGALPLRVVESLRPAAAAESLRARMWAAEFDLGREPPLRVGLVTSARRVRRIVLVCSHLAADGWASQLLLRDLRLLLRRPASELEPAGPQPVDRAREEQADNGRSTRAAIRYWTEQYRRIPATFLLPVGPSEGPANSCVRLTSTALPIAARLAAARARTSTSTVLMAAAAALLAGYTGNRCVAMSVVSSNRFQPRYRRMVGTLTQLALFVLEVPPQVGFHDLLPRAAQAAIGAYTRASYDHIAVDRALEAAQHPGRVDVAWMFNDARVPSALSGEEELGRVRNQPADLRRMSARSVLTRRPSPAWMRGYFLLAVEESAGTWRLELTANSRWLPAHEIERFLHGLEQIVVAAASGDPQVGGWPPPARSG